MTWNRNEPLGKNVAAETDNGIGCTEKLCSVAVSSSSMNVTVLAPWYPKLLRLEDSGSTDQFPAITPRKRGRFLVLASFGRRVKFPGHGSELPILGTDPESECADRWG